MLVGLAGLVVGCIITVVVVGALLEMYKTTVRTRAERRLIEECSPLALLAARYARGDVDDDEFLRSVAVLRHATEPFVELD